MTDDFFAKLDSFFAGSALSGTDRADLRLRILTDHFATLADPSPEELARTETVLGEALADASPAAAGAMAARIAQHPHATSLLLAKLIALGGAAAEGALRWGRDVPRASLLAVAEHGTTAVAAALAARDNLEPALAAVLFRRTEGEVLRTLTKNPGVSLDRVTATWLIQRARHDNELARAILARKPLGCDLTPLFLAADEAERADMLVAARRRDLGTVPEYRRTSGADDMLAPLVVREDRGAFAEALARKLGISRDDAVRLIDDAGGEALALALNVANVPSHGAATILNWLGKAAADDPRHARLLVLAGDFASQSARRILGAVFGRPIATHTLSPRAASDVPSRNGNQGMALRTGSPSETVRDSVRRSSQ